MNRFAKLITLILAAVVVISMVFFAGSGRTNAASGGSDPLYYPTLLVHGLGEGPGEQAFGNLQKYLKTFYFQSDVMDFNDFTHNKLADLPKAKQGTLDVLAAVLGDKIEKMKKDFKASKVNIIAHSYGGLIVNAYLANLGEAQDKKVGGFGDDVNKVIYIESPFYGATGDESLIAQLAEETDFGPFLNAKEIETTLTMGSSWISTVDTELRKSGVLTNGIVDVLTLASENDEVTSVPFSVLTGFTAKLGDPARYRIYKNYSHSQNDLSIAAADTNKGSLAYIENILDENFVAIASFLDSGERWIRTGTGELPQTSYLMINYEKETGFTTLKESDVSLTYAGKLDATAAGSVKTAKTKRLNATSDYDTFYNSKSRTWVFYNIKPAKYKLKINNAKGDGIADQELSLTAEDQVGFDYFPKDNQLLEGNSRINSDLAGFFKLVNYIYTSDNEEKISQLIPQLNVNGFEIEFTIEGADTGDFNKGAVFAIYNQDGSSDHEWHNNGSRIQFMLRGEYSGADPVSPHAGEAFLVYAVDKNKNGYADYDPDHGMVDASDVKSDATWDWEVKHDVLIRVTGGAGHSNCKLWIDNELVFDINRSDAYWNPQPVISIPGRRFEGKDYTPPAGAKLNLAIRNIN